MMFYTMKGVNEKRSEHKHSVRRLVRNDQVLLKNTNQNMCTANDNGASLAVTWERPMREGKRYQGGGRRGSRNGCKDLYCYIGSAKLQSLAYHV